MNVIISNEQQEQLATLDIDVIKSITGIYEPTEIVQMFSGFFFSKMIIDVTAIKHYTEIKSYEVISKGLDPEKIIFYIPEGSSLSTASFLASLVSVGIYNFTTNLSGIKTLLNRSNTIRDVSDIVKMGMTDAKVISSHVSNIQNTSDMVTNSRQLSGDSIVIGFKNVTEHAGATSLIYMLKNELEGIFGKENVVALEIDQSDFQLFKMDNMISIRQMELKAAINKLNKKVVLIDLNDSSDTSMCAEVFYLIEPSTLKLNKLIRRNRSALMSLHNRKVLLNQSLLNNNDIADFEQEANLKVFFNIPPLDDRSKNSILNDFLTKIGLVSNPFAQSKMNSSKIFGLFRR